MSTTVQIKVYAPDHHSRIDVYLAEKLDGELSRSFVKKLITQGFVTVNEESVKPNYLINTGDDISVTIPKGFVTPKYVEPEDIPIDIFYESPQFVIVNKPSGLLVHPARGRYRGTLVNALLYRKISLSDFNPDHLRPGIIHRLDEETSGLMIVAKDNITHTKLAKQFQKRVVKKQYVAIVEGEVEFDEGVIDVPIGMDPKHRDRKMVRYDDSAKEARTMYRVIRRNNKHTLIALYPHTGRTHQLRVHMRHLGHPILGDSKYGKRSTFPRLALHAQSIGFKHPDSKKWLSFSTKMPDEFLKAK